METVIKSVKIDPTFDEKFKKELEEGFGDLCQIILEEARRTVPVDTGLLKSNIKTLKFNNLEAEIGTDGSQYALFVHEGTVKQSSQPFLKQALYNILSRIK